MKNGKDIHVISSTVRISRQKICGFYQRTHGYQDDFYGHDLHFIAEVPAEYELTGDVKKRQESEYWKSIGVFTLPQSGGVLLSVLRRRRRRSTPLMRRFRSRRSRHMSMRSFTESEQRLRQTGRTPVCRRLGIRRTQTRCSGSRKKYSRRSGEQIKVNFYIVGSKVTDEIKALEQPGNGIIVKGFVSEEELADLYRNCRIVVVPLRYGAGVKGKVVEAIYNGAPSLPPPSAARESRM